MTDIQRNSRGQFEKGVSGNRGGRPKKEAKVTTNITKVLGDELQKEIELVEGGKVVRLTKLEALVKSNLLNAIKKGDLKHLKFIIEQSEKLGLKRMIPEKIIHEFIYSNARDLDKNSKGQEGNDIP